MKKSTPDNQPLARALLYKFLSRVFDYPRLEIPADIRVSVQAAAAMRGVEEQVRTLARALTDTTPSDLEREYVGALGHVAKNQSPPYETSYGNQHTFQQTAELADIAAFYRSQGLGAAGDERLDHISPELEFMAFLALKEAADPLRADEIRAAQKQFFEEHLGRWAPAFAEKLQAGQPARAVFGLAAGALSAFLKSELKELDAVPASFRSVDATPARFGPEGACFSCGLGDDQSQVRPEELL